MKNKIFTLATLVTLTCLVNKVSAQYNFTSGNSPFTFLTNPTVLSDSTGWDDADYYHAIGFPVEVDSVTYDSMAIESNGSVIFYKNPADYQNIFSSTDTLPVFIAYGEYISNYYGADLHDRPSGSPISYELSGTVGSRIAKVEWKNAGFYNDNGTNYEDSINFQIWIYEGSGNIEYRYGTNSVKPITYNIDTTTMDSGAVIGIAQFDVYNLSLISGMYLTGSVSSATTTTTYSQTTGTPAANTFYKFAKAGTISVSEESAKLNLKVYPNPASNVLNVAYSSEETVKVSLSDVTGRVVMEEVVAAGNAKTQMDISHLQGAQRSIEKVVIK
jgi:hypothetical protein